MRRRVILAVLVAVGLAASPALAKHHRFAHHHECVRLVCALNADRAYARHHRPKFIVTAFDLCVANHEEGTGVVATLGNSRMGTVHWRTQQGVYGGGYSEEQSKWEAGGGLRYAPHAWEASALDQIRAFHQNGRNGEWTLSNWPTIAYCRG